MYGLFIAGIRQNASMCGDAIAASRTGSAILPSNSSSRCPRYLLVTGTNLLLASQMSLAFSVDGWSRSLFAIAVAVDIQRQLEPSLLNI
jgi:hypothetical protein